MKKLILIPVAIILLSIIIGIYLYPQLPNSLASHWNASGEVNGYMSKFWGLFLVPLISIALFLLLTFIPYIDPLKQNIKQFQKYYDIFIIILISFMFYIYLLTIFWNLNYRFNFVQAIIPAFIILFYYAGILLQHSKQNWFIGIRTPWTLANKEVWDKTHKLGGKLFKTVSLISILAIFFPSYGIFFVIIPIMLAAVYSVVYSYLIYKKTG